MVTLMAPPVTSPSGVRRTRFLSIRVDDVERARIVNAARMSNTPIGQVVRNAALAAAAEILEPQRKPTAKR